MITVHALSPNVEVIAEGEPPPLPAPLEAEVAAIWDAEKARRGAALYDGRVFSVAEVARARIVGRFVSYRRLIAQKIRPELFGTLRIRPLGVSGLLACRDGIVFGRRAADVTDDPGLWELVPSGGVSPECADSSGRVNLGRQILAELAEETGMRAESIERLEMFCAVDDDVSRVVDVGIALTSSRSGGDVRDAHAKSGGGEYTELAVVARADVPAFAAGRGRDLIAVSRALLDRANLT